MMTGTQAVEPREAPRKPNGPWEMRLDWAMLMAGPYMFHGVNPEAWNRAVLAYIMKWSEER